MQELYWAQQNVVNLPDRGYWDIQSSEGPFLLGHLQICIFFFCLKVFSSSHLHIQTGTDLKWFQEGPCLLLCFTFCVWPSTTNLFYLFILFSHAGTILYCKHLSFCNPSPRTPKIHLAEKLSVVPSMGVYKCEWEQNSPMLLLKKSLWLSVSAQGRFSITVEYLGIFPWESAA